MTLAVRAAWTASPGEFRRCISPPAVWTGLRIIGRFCVNAFDGGRKVGQWSGVVLALWVGVRVRRWRVDLFRILEGAIRGCLGSPRELDFGGAIRERPSWMSIEPSPGIWMPVSRVAVEDGVDRLPRQNLLFDGVRKADELGRRWHWML